MLGPTILADLSTLDDGKSLYITRPNLPAYLDTDRMLLRGVRGEVSGSSLGSLGRTA